MERERERVWEKGEWNEWAMACEDWVVSWLTTTGDLPTKIDCFMPLISADVLLPKYLSPLILLMDLISTESECEGKLRYMRGEKVGQGQLIG